MVARLWWKDARQFWPIGALLVILALAVQWLALHYEYPEARQGGMATVALGWTCLYAFAVAAAAFAGERETRTLGLLDALPVERWRLWLAKSSFALASTMALGLFLFAAASLVTERWQMVTPGWGLLVGGLVLLWVLGWGLLWSSATSNALLAAVLAICSSFLFLPASIAGVRLGLDERAMPLLNMAVAVLTGLGSAFLFIRSGPPSRPILSRRTPSRLSQAKESPASIGVVKQSRPRYWPAAAWSLAWQALREVRPIVGWLVLLGLAVALLTYLGWSQSQALAWSVYALAAVILAGISVFGIENRARSQAFLTNHGVGPRLVWLVKVGMWVAAMTALGIMFALLVILGAVFAGFPSVPSLRGVEGISEFMAGVLGYSALVFAVAVLCGMVIRRGITAWLVTVVFCILLAFPLGSLSAMGLVPLWFVWLIPLALLAVSLAWCPDWMLDRPGAWRWVKLAFLLAGSFAVLFAGYVAYRVASVPSLDPARDAELFTFQAPTSVPEAENAAALYRNAVPKDRANVFPLEMWEQVNRVYEKGWNPNADEAISWYRECASEMVADPPGRCAALLPVRADREVDPIQPTL